MIPISLPLRRIVIVGMITTPSILVAACSESRPALPTEKELATLMHKAQIHEIGCKYADPPKDKYSGRWVVECKYDITVKRGRSNRQKTVRETGTQRLQWIEHTLPNGKTEGTWSYG